MKLFGALAAALVFIMQQVNVSALDHLLGSMPPGTLSATVGPQGQYEGARTTRSNANWRPSVRSANREIRPDFKTLQARALWLARNEPVCDGARQTIVDEVIGGDGIQANATARGDDRNLLTEYNTEVDDFLREWEDECDVQEERDWTAMTAENLSDTIVQGNCFLVESYNPDPARVSPIQYELLEPHQLDRRYDNYAAWLSSGGNLVMEGIKYDHLGRPLSYFMHRSQPDILGMGLGYSVPEEVPASRVIHLFRRERSQQKIGVTWFRKIIAKIWSADDYMNSEIDAAANASKLVAMFKSEDGQGLGMTIDDTGTVVDSHGNPYEGLGPSTILTGGPQDSIEVINGNRPNGSGEAFLKFLMRAMGLGMHLSYYRMSGDSSGLSYSNLRAENAKDDAYFDPVRGWQIWRVNRRARNRVLAEAVVMGRIKNAPSPCEFLAMQRRYLAAEYIAGSTKFIDKDKEVRASIGAIQGALSTYQYELAQQGKDWRQVFRQLAEERAYAGDLGLPVEAMFDPASAMKSSKGLPQTAGQKQKAQV